MAVMVSDTSPLNPRGVGGTHQARHPRPGSPLGRAESHLVGSANTGFACSSRVVHLGTGEAQAITLALECRAEVLLLDERDGTAAARSAGLVVTGTLGVLDIAAGLGWADLPTMFARLRLTTFRLPGSFDGNHVGRGCDSNELKAES